MFTINKQEYKEIVSIISGCCCPCTGRHGHCTEVECDVQMICEILWEHLEKNDIKSDEEPNIEWPSGKPDTNCDIDKLPFRK